MTIQQLEAAIIQQHPLITIDGQGIRLAQARLLLTLAKLHNLSVITTQLLAAIW